MQRSDNGCPAMYLRFPAGVDSTLLMAVPGFAVADCLGKEAERPTSLDFNLATGVDKVTRDYGL